MRQVFIMTIKKRLFLSNILMLIIPALVSILIIVVSSYVVTSVFYKQLMDESVNENDLSYIHGMLVEQSKEYLKNQEKLTDSKMYRTVEKYLESQNIKLEISYDDGIVCNIGSSMEIDPSLSAAMEKMNGEGSISVNGSCLFGEKVIVDDTAYHILIYSSIPIQESQFNEILVTNIIVLLCILIITAVIITNRFLTKFVFKKIEAPLDILTDGVHQIRDGNLDYRIEYKGRDEFKSVCEDFNDMAARLKESVETSQKNEQNRKELIAGISHDLRTPLTAVKAYIEGLLEGVAATPQMQQKYMRTIRDKANDIDRMVDKLFLFSKLDLGDCPFYPEKLDIRQELHSIVSSGSKDYSEKGLEIHCKTVPEDCHVYADPVQLRSAVTNILENSLKYKDEKTVNVTIHCEDLPENLDLIIDDDGPGVPQEALPKLFDVFYRSDPSRNNPNKGSGLGLAITAKILEHSGGSIHAENLQPKGLRIVMTLPKEKKDE